MANGNPKLADVLARRGEPEEILGALVDGGILLVSDPQGSVLVGQMEDESIVLAGFTDPGGYPDKAEGEEFQHADAALLLEITRSGEVDALVIDPDSENATLVPLSDVRGFLIARGMNLEENAEVAFRPSDHELVAPLTEAIA